MKPQIATTPEQSARLIACGVKESTADMLWTEWNNDGEHLVQLSVMDESAYEASCLNPIPAWSLSALLTTVIPPKIITGVGDEKFTHKPELMRCKDGWILILFAIHTADDPIECAVLCIEWLTANDYPLNAIDQ